jgi:hypothetical protein
MKPQLQLPPAMAGQGAPPGHPASLMLVRVFADRIEVNEQYGDERTLDLVRALRQLGVVGEVIFRTPCG